MSEIFDAYLGFAKETTFGTAVAASRFYVFNSEGISGKYERIESEGLRAGSRTLREDRWVVNPKGAEGDFEVEVESKGFGFWLEHMLGTVTSATGTGGLTNFNAVPGSLRGKSFTAQVNRPSTDGSNNIFTYTGGKVMDWELSNDVDGFLTAKMNCDFAKETIGAGTGALAAQTPTYKTGVRVLSFVGGYASIGGTAVKIKQVSITGKNGLEAERFFLGQTAKSEQLEKDLREYEFEVTLEFTDMTQRARVASATAAGAVATFTVGWNSDVAETAGGTAFLEVFAPVARFDEGDINVDGMDLLEIKAKGKFLEPVSGAAPVQITYATADATA